MTASPQHDNTNEIFDREGLSERLVNDGDLVAEVIETFLRDIPHCFAQLEEAIAGGDWAEALRESHSIKGAAANVGANLLRHAALSMERALRGGDRLEVTAALEGMKQRFHELRRQMEKGGF
jgi:HPt (histidine-containing phosphotransfer) domain-containing protein